MVSKAAQQEPIPSRMALGVSELATNAQGALSPYGPDAKYAVAPNQLNYQHPTAADRPHLAIDSQSHKN